MVGVTSGLLAAGACVALLVFTRSGEIDREAELADLFRSGAPPEGFVLSQGVRQSSGGSVLRLTRADGAASGEGRPAEILLVRPASQRQVEALFDPDGEGSAEEASLQMLEWEVEPSFEFRALLERGELAWSRWLADFRAVRLFEEEGAWRDCAYVNLSRRERPLVLFALWAPGEAFSLEALRALLATVRLDEEP